jgi:hypothetical protein
MSDDILRLAAGKMKPYKSTFPDSAPNCVIKICTDLLLPFLGPIYRSLDELRHYPAEWAELRILVMRKPGKSSYAELGAHRPIALSKGFARWLNGAKDIQQVSEAELAGVLPRNQYGARPGRSTTDALHKVFKVIKDAWREGCIATVLCIDVKGAFPSVALDRLYHDLCMWGIPVWWGVWPC